MSIGSNTLVRLHDVRSQFPVLNQLVQGHPFVYLDNGATTQKPIGVIDRVHQFLSSEYATVHRGVYWLSQLATDACEQTRASVAKWVNAPDPRGVVFTAGATQSLNMIASCWAATQLKSGDRILISQMEHHANIVPWQQVANRTGAILDVCRILPDGQIDMDHYRQLIGLGPKLVSFTHVSNVLGTINPVDDMTRLAKDQGALVVIDGSQAVAHVPVDVQAIGCDFYVFSSHKMYGPTGVGILVGSLARLNEMPPYQFGGDMIESVTFESSTFAPVPAKFEAGTPPITEIIGMGAAVSFLMSLGWGYIETHEKWITGIMMDQIGRVPGVRLIGTAPNKIGVVSFVMDGVHPHDVGTILDTEGVAVRVGHHCAQPLMGVYNVPATIRASAGVYTTEDDIHRLIRALNQVRGYFS